MIRRAFKSFSINFHDKQNIPDNTSDCSITKKTRHRLVIKICFILLHKSLIHTYFDSFTSFDFRGSVLERPQLFSEKS